MKTSPQSRKKKNSRFKWVAGFSLLELLMVLGVISTVAAVGIFMVSGVTGSIKISKLQSDVATLNSAVRTYLTHGGVFAAGTNGQKVLDQMKTVADSTSKLRLAGVRSSMIDARLRGILATGNGTERAVWNPAKQRFEVKTSGTGFSDFDLAGTPPAVDAEEKRQGSMGLAARDKWVWDSGATSTGRVTPTAVLTTSVASVEAAPPTGPVQLATPAFSLPGALYNLSDYTPNLSVSLMDRNAPGMAKILYSVNDGPWLEYKGIPLSIPPAFFSTVRTYAAAINSDSYEDSDLRTANYETIYFTGTSAGNFYSPAGDKKLVSNLTGTLRLPVFKWGTPADFTEKQNQLTFTGSSFAKIAPDKEFVLGTLSYYNGTTSTGTNATSVKIAIDLNLSEPAVKETLTFTFNLLSTPNNGRSEDADADYVYIPDVSTNFSTTIKGKKFALVLRFGEHTADGFTTIDTFHAHEGKTLTGSIYGRLTEVK